MANTTKKYGSRDGKNKPATKAGPTYQGGVAASLTKSAVKPEKDAPALVYTTSAAKSLTVSAVKPPK